MSSVEPDTTVTTALDTAEPGTAALPVPVTATNPAATLVPPAPPSPRTTEIACPSCGTVSYYTELGRDASGFCRECDFPLFWARTPRPAAAGIGDGDGGLRRLPGTAGRVALATIDCPACTEPNPVASVICIRCGSELRPAPPIVLPPPEPVIVPEPEPLPVPAPPPRVLWPWILLVVMAVAGVVALVVALAQ